MVRISFYTIKRTYFKEYMDGNTPCEKLKSFLCASPHYQFLLEIVDFGN